MRSSRPLPTARRHHLDVCSIRAPRNQVVEYRLRAWGDWQPPSTDRIPRGISLMEALADELHIKRRPDGTEVTLAFFAEGLS